jgi:hypothetical protein
MNDGITTFIYFAAMKQLWGRMGPWGGSPKPQTSSSHHAFGAAMAGHQVTLTVGSAPAKVFSNYFSNLFNNNHFN